MARHNWVTWTGIDRKTSELSGGDLSFRVQSISYSLLNRFGWLPRQENINFYIFISKNRTEICKTKKNTRTQNQKMKRMEREEECLKQELEELQKQLGKKLKFEEAVSSLNSLLQDRYPSASPSLHRLVWPQFLSLQFSNSLSLSLFLILTLIIIQWQFYTVICRVATVLKTRYTAPGFWLAGLGLFEKAVCLVSDTSEKEYLKTCILQAKEHLHQLDNPIEAPQSSNRGLNVTMFLLFIKLKCSFEKFRIDWLNFWLWVDFQGIYLRGILLWIQSHRSLIGWCIRTSWRLLLRSLQPNPLLKAARKMMIITTRLRMLLGYFRISWAGSMMFCHWW